MRDAAAAAALLAAEARFGLLATDRLDELLAPLLPEPSIIIRGVHVRVGFSEVMSLNSACTSDGRTATFPMNPGPSFISLPVEGLEVRKVAAVALFQTALQYI